MNKPGEPVTPEPASFRSVEAALHWFSVKPGQVGSLSILRPFHDAEFYCLTFSNPAIDRLWDVSRDDCPVSEDDLAGVIGMMKSFLFFTLNR